MLQVQVFLLQIQLAKTALEQTRQRSWKIFQAQARTKQVVSLAKMTAAQDAAPARSRALPLPAPAEDPKAAVAGVIDILYGLEPPSLRPQQASAVGRAAAAAAAAAGALLSPAEERAVQQEMVNFVHNLHQSVIDRLLLNAWVELERVRHRRGWKLFIVHNGQ